MSNLLLLSSHAHELARNSLLERLDDVCQWSRTQEFIRSIAVMMQSRGQVHLDLVKIGRDSVPLPLCHLAAVHFSERELNAVLRLRFKPSVTTNAHYGGAEWLVHAKHRIETLRIVPCSLLCMHAGETRLLAPFSRSTSLIDIHLCPFKSAASTQTSFISELVVRQQVTSIIFSFVFTQTMKTCSAPDRIEPIACPSSH